MTKLFEILTDDDSAVGPTFTSWEAARQFKNENEIPGRIVSFDDPTEEPGDPFPSNPEPQEMTARWAKDMEANQ